MLDRCNSVCAAAAACELNEPDLNVIDLTIASMFAFRRDKKKSRRSTFALNLGQLMLTFVSHRPRKLFKLNEESRMFHPRSPQRNVGSEVAGQAPASQCPVHHITRSPSVHFRDITSSLLLSRPQSRKRDNFPIILEIGSI